jgi:hypothetical protein
LIQVAQEMDFCVAAFLSVGAFLSVVAFLMVTAIHHQKNAEDLPDTF